MHPGLAAQSIYMRLSILKINLFFLFLLIGKLLQAQTIPPADTLESSRQLAYSKNYLPSIELLSAYELNHPDEINSVRLHAQILYWNQDYKKAFKLCESFLKRNPNPYLKLDYARMLFEQANLNKAKEILNNYIKTDKSNIEANNMLGTISYWQGNPAHAKFYFKKVLDKYPQNEWALKVMQDLKANSSPFIKINTTYSDDTQPLTSTGLGLETGWHQSAWLNPRFNFQLLHFNDSLIKQDNYSFQVSNQFTLSKLKTELILAGGAFKNTSGNEFNWTGFATIHKKLFKNLILSASVERKPYLYTISGLKNTTMQNSYTGSLAFEKQESWSGMAFYNVQDFLDQNQVNTFGVWILTPPIHFSKFGFKFGYGNNFSDAKENRFTSTKSIAEIIADNTPIEGIYNPYFTPTNQEIHSVIGNLSFKTSNSFLLTINGSYGVYAKTDNPYLYLDTNANAEIIINKGYSFKKFNPYDFTGILHYYIGNKLILSGSYSYSNTVYYNINKLEFSIKYMFTGE